MSGKLQGRMRRLVTAMGAVAIVLCVAVAPLCASWCSGHGCTANSVVPLVTAEHEGCHHAMNGGVHLGWSATAADALCPAGEFVVSSLRADALVAAGVEEIATPRVAVAVNLAADFAAVGDSASRIRSSSGSSSFSPDPVSDLATPLRI